MRLYPAIDLKDGCCVRLKQGVYDDKTVYAEEPWKVAVEFEQAGAGFIHLVDLDGAREGRSVNDEAVKAIVAHVSIPLEIGGGVRSLDDIEHRLSLGVSRVILGTKACEDPEFVKDAIERFGADKIVVGIDAKNGLVATKGWETVSEVTATNLALKMKEIGVKTIIYTDISRDGMLSGPNIETTKKLVDETGLDIVASGGVSCLDDLKKLSGIGVEGAIFGKAIYEKKLDLKEAVKLYMEQNSKKKIIASIDAENESRETVLELVSNYDYSGVDMLFLYNYSKDEKTRDEFISTLRLVRDRTDLPFFAGVYVNRLEDVKKAYYTGACKVVIDMEAISDPELLKAAVTKIGGKNVYALVNFGKNYKEEEIHEIGQMCLKYVDDGVGGLMAKHLVITPKIYKYLNENVCDVIIRDALERNSITELLELPNVSAIATDFYAERDVYTVKKSLSEQGYPIITPTAAVEFKDLKLNDQGLVPCIVQDYRTNEVLMLAYMNEESYNKTVETGRMTYYSRSRQELWIKGETSGHYQFVKEISVDCDKDTILAKVKQIGAACHTGNYSCFFTEVLKKEFENDDISFVLDKVFNVILDRKNNPKEGSYTNYLFDKGIDKILKKCGEEATEIVIAAKNPDHEELRYEIADFLYHMMVLMAETGLSWTDISRELASRE